MDTCKVCGGFLHNKRCRECGMVYKQMTISPKDWYNKYYMDDDVVKYFHEQRVHIFRKVTNILIKHTVSSILDIGTSTGVMVKTALGKGIDAYGVDFDFPVLKEIHERIGIKDRIIYIKEELNLYAVFDLLTTKGVKIQCVTLLDTLRYIYDFENIFKESKNYGAEIILVKEVSAASFMERKRREEKEKNGTYFR